MQKSTSLRHETSNVPPPKQKKKSKRDSLKGPREIEAQQGLDGEHGLSHSGSFSQELTISRAGQVF